MFVLSAPVALTHLLASAYAWLLAGLFALTHNLAVAIVLAGVITLVVTWPIGTRSARAAVAGRAVSPELARIRARYRTAPTASADERTDAAYQMQSELRAAMRAHGYRPVAAVLALVVQLPFLFALRSALAGLSHTAHGVAQPLLAPRSSLLYRSVVAHHGTLVAFGVNLATHLVALGTSWPALAFVAAVVGVGLAVQLAYLRLSSRERNPERSRHPVATGIGSLVVVVPFLAAPAWWSLYALSTQAMRLVQLARVLHHS